ncbi:MAG: hypothetical protein EBQ96_08610 [Proteobacteria bacterium]|nr:hypothetical protein [Pseudomonadota bacterium]
MFGSFDNVASMAPRSASADSKMATIAVPVCFSPSQAVKIAETIAQAGTTAQPQQLIRGTFFFEANSPSYRLDDPRTHEAIAELHNNGHQIGVMLGVTVDSTAAKLENELVQTMRTLMTITGLPIAAATFRTVGVSAKRVQALKAEIQPLLDRVRLKTTHDAFASAPNVGLAMTSNGIYKNGHPLEIIEQNKPFALLNLIECWFSDQPKWALDRLGNLPEVDSHTLAVRRDFLDNVKLPILGSKRTTEVVPEFAMWQGQHGFRDGLRLQASG